MGPKVEAITRFVKAAGRRGIICRLEDIEQAVAGEAGTEVDGPTERENACSEKM